jgi:hypothetical protein
MILERRCCWTDNLIEKCLAPFSVDLQLFGPLGHGPEMFHQHVAIASSQAKYLRRPKYGNLITDDAQHYKSQYRDEQEWRHDAHVNQASDYHGRIHAKYWNYKNAVGDQGYIIGEGRQEAVRAELLQMAQGRSQHLADQLNPQRIKGALAQGIQEDFRGKSRQGEQGAEANKNCDQRIAGCAISLEHDVNERQ